MVNPFDEGIPEEKWELEKIRKLFLSRDSLKNRLVSDDSKETIVSLAL